MNINDKILIISLNHNFLGVMIRTTNDRCKMMECSPVNFDIA